MDALIRKPEAESLGERLRWERIAAKMRSGEMPPKGVARPPAEQVRTVAAWIDDAYARLDRTRPVDPGRVTARRLNRVEYANSVRDLLGIDMLPGEDLPPDPYGYGFDNIGDVLSMNTGLAEEYLKVAERIAQAAVPVDGDAPKATMRRYLAERIGQDRQMRMRVDHAFPVDGEYTLRTAFYQALKDGTLVEMKLYVDGRQVGGGTLKFYYQIDRGIEAPRVKMTAGRHRIEASIEVLADPPYKGSPPYLEYVQVYGPLAVGPAVDSPQYRRFARCMHMPGLHHDGCAREILRPLASLAFRRPVSAGELDGLLSLAAKEQARTGSFEQAMRSCVMAVLMSPHFLFRVERDRIGVQGAGAVSEYELAARLSYFLWSSVPDDELLRLAARGRLAAALPEQVRRMLADPKSSAFVENFTGQWLQTRNLRVTTPDAKLFPSFNGELAEAMKTETEMVFGEILRENRSVLDLLDARFTYLNEALAKHYGIDGVKGREFQRVELDGVQRGGVLGHASVLTVSSYPTRTSAVIRGKWILENILNEPPPPPPPDVPGLEDPGRELTGTMRQQLEKHRTNPACAACHARMDPLGFGLENYDAIGRWRTHEGEAPIDVSGELPGGERFASPAELRAILKANRDGFTRGLAEKLLTYATGRGMELSDRAAVRKIAERVRDNGYRMQELVMAVVESEPFRMRRMGAESKLGGESKQ